MPASLGSYGVDAVTEGEREAPCADRGVALRCSRLPPQARCDGAHATYRVFDDAIAAGLLVAEQPMDSAKRPVGAMHGRTGRQQQTRGQRRLPPVGGDVAERRAAFDEEHGDEHREQRTEPSPPAFRGLAHVRQLGRGGLLNLTFLLKPLKRRRVPTRRRRGPEVAENSASPFCAVTVKSPRRAWCRVQRVLDGERISAADRPGRGVGVWV